MSFLIGGINYYHAWAEEYYERKIDFTAIKKVYKNLSVTEEELFYLNEDLKINDLEEDVAEII